MGGIVDEIKNNEIETLHLMNDPDDYFEHTRDFVDALKSNSSIKKVVFEKDFLACINGQARADVVGAVGKLPNIEVVQLKDSLLMVGVCVKDLVNNGSKLQELHVDNCVLQGVPESFEHWGDALKGSSSIKTLHINDCVAPNESVDLNQVMETLRDDLKDKVTVSGGGAKA